MTQYTGLVIDGPCFGRNITANMPFIRKAVTPDAEHRLNAGLPTDPMTDIIRVDYEWSAGVWACGRYLDAWSDWIPDAGQPPRTGTGRSSRGNVS